MLNFDATMVNKIISRYKSFNWVVVVVLSAGEPVMTPSIRITVKVFPVRQSMVRSAHSFDPQLGLLVSTAKVMCRVFDFNQCSMYLWSSILGGRGSQPFGKSETLFVVVAKSVYIR